MASFAPPPVILSLPLARRRNHHQNSEMRFGWSLLLALAAHQPSVAKTLPIGSRAQLVETMSAQHKAVFRRYVGIWESGVLDKLSGVLAPNYVGHAADGSRGAEELSERIAQFHKLYLGVRFIIEDQVAEGDRVATRMTATATSSATGKPVKLIGLNISRFQDGRIAEEWPVWEVMP